MSVERELASMIQRYFAIIKMPRDPEAQVFLNSCKAATVTVKGAKYTYYRCGSGPKVLLVHGLHANLDSMVELASSLMDRYEVILFDAPAHGEAAGMMVTMPQLQSFAQALGEELGPLHGLVAHSFGVLWALSAWGGALSAKTVVSISGPTSTRFLTEKFIDMNSVGDELAERLYQQLERRFGETYWEDFSLPVIARSLKVPGLIIHSQDDTMVPSTHAHEIGEGWPEAEVMILEGEEHFKLCKLDVVTELVGKTLDATLPVELSRA